MNYSTYILYSDRLDKYYIGSTQDIDERLRRHNLGLNKYTKTGTLCNIVYSQESATRSEAMSKEKKIKAKKSRKYIEWLIDSVA